MIAGYDEYIAVSVGERIERRLQRQSTLERCIDIGVVCINVPTILFVGCAGLNAFAQRVAGILKELMSGDWAGYVDDVIGIERAKSAYGPVQQSLGDIEVTAQSGLARIGHDLLQRGIADQRVVDQAGLDGIRAAELERRRRPVCDGEVAVDRKIGRELVGRSGHRVEVTVIVTAVKQRIVAKLVRQRDLG